MQQTRESDVVKAVTVAKDNYRFVGSHIAALSHDLFGEYLGCVALGHCNPGLSTRLSTGLMDLASSGRGSDVLVAVLCLDRQMPSPREPASARILDSAFDLSLGNTASVRPEVAFAKAAISEMWARRRAERERTEGWLVSTQKIVTEPRKLLKFVTNMR
jgi:hypothetical protein